MRRVVLRHGCYISAAIRDFLLFYVVSLNTGASVIANAVYGPAGQFVGGGRPIAVARVSRGDSFLRTRSCSAIRYGRVQQQRVQLRGAVVRKSGTAAVKVV